MQNALPIATGPADGALFLYMRWDSMSTVLTSSSHKKLKHAHNTQVFCSCLDMLPSLAVLCYCSSMQALAAAAALPPQDSVGAAAVVRSASLSQPGLALAPGKS